MNGRSHLTCSPELTERAITTVDGVRLAVHDLNPRHPTAAVVFLHGLCLNQGKLGTAGPLPRPAMGPTHADRHRRSPRTSIIELRARQHLHHRPARRQPHVGHHRARHPNPAHTGRALDGRHGPPDLLLPRGGPAPHRSQRHGRSSSQPPHANSASAALTHVATHTPERILHRLVTPLCVTLAPIRGHLPAATIAATALTALTTTATSTAIGYLPSLRSYDIYPGLPAIRARTVIIGGGVDPLTPPQRAHEMAAAIPDARHLHVPTGGHMLRQQARNVVNRAIEQAAGLPPKPKNASASRIDRAPRATRRQPHVRAPLPDTG